MLIRSATQTDRDSWERMRQALWPSPARGHAGEIDRYFAGKLRERLEVLIAFHERGEAIGFIELSIRAYAEGCVSDRVAFVEGWYVEPDIRRKGVGTALIQAAENWARSQGCMELGSSHRIGESSKRRSASGCGIR